MIACRSSSLELIGKLYLLEIIVRFCQFMSGRLVSPAIHMVALECLVMMLSRVSHIESIKDVSLFGGLYIEQIISGELFANSMWQHTISLQVVIESS